MTDELNLPLDQVSDLRHRVRRLHWFQQSFKREAVALGDRYGRTFEINDRALAEAFFKWAEAFARERVDSRRNRGDFAVFAGGLMLRELLRAAPAVSRGKGKFSQSIPPDPMAEVCEFWPDGFLYANYCLTLVRAILEADFHTHVTPAPFAKDLRVWQSFRENFAHDASLAVPFFDLFMGREPNWAAPEYFLSRPSVRATEALPDQAEN